MEKRKRSKGSGPKRPGLNQRDSAKMHRSPSVHLREALLLSVLPILVFLIYANTLKAPFIYDDVPNIENNPHIRLNRLTLEGLVKAGLESRSSKRPVANISFALNYYFHKYNVSGYHLVNILIHASTGILLYLLVRTTLNTPYLRSRYESDIWVAFTTALIWLVHPVHTQSVTYIVQRMNSMAAMFYVLAIFLYARARLAERKKRKIVLFTGCIFAGVLALGSKQNAGTLPFFIVLYEWYFFQDLRKDWLKRHLKHFVGILVIMGLIASVYLGMNPEEEIMNRKDFVNKEFAYTERVLTQFRVIIHYLTLLIFPHPSRLNLYYDFPVSRSLVDPITTLLSMLGIAGLIGLSIYVAKKERLLSFCILWFFGNLLIESSVIPLAIIYEHRIYLPSMFLILMAVIMGFRYIKPKGVGIGVICLVFLIFSFWTYQRNRIWRDDVSLWADCVRKAPKKALPRLNLGYALEKRGRIEEAIARYSEVLGIDPNFVKAHYNLGIAFERQGKVKEAIGHYLEALRINPNFSEAHVNLGVSLAGLGRYEEATSHFLEALRLKPTSDQAYYNLARVLERQGSSEKAISNYRAAIDINPDFAEAHKSLGVALEKRGNLEEAVNHYIEALRIDPNYAEAHTNLGVAREKQGRLAEAVSHYSEALRLKPDYAKAHYNLGSALLRQERLDEALNHLYQALRIDPNYEKAHYNLGAALARQGDLKGAAYHFSEVLRINPNDARARRALELVSR